MPAGGEGTEKSRAGLRAEPVQVRSLLAGYADHLAAGQEHARLATQEPAYQAAHCPDDGVILRGLRRTHGLQHLIAIQHQQPFLLAQSVGQLVKQSILIPTPVVVSPPDPLRQTVQERRWPRGRVQRKPQDPLRETPAEAMRAIVVDAIPCTIVVEYICVSIQDRGQVCHSRPRPLRPQGVPSPIPTVPAIVNTPGIRCHILVVCA